MKEHDISQLPVMDNDTIVGSITETAVLSYLLQNPLHNTDKSVAEIMGDPFPMVAVDLPFSKLSHYISKKIPAVIAKDQVGMLHIITKYDIIQAV